MTVSHKVAVTLLISVLLFAVFTVLAFTGLFDLVETRFYNPSIISGLSKEVDRDARAVADYFEELEARFSATLSLDAVERSFLPNQSAEDIFERSKAYGTLLESFAGLQAVRFVDAGGRRIHFSTARADLLRQDRQSVAYRNYGEAAEDLPFETLAAGADAPPRRTPDPAADRIIFSFPFYDSFAVYKGTALFYLSTRAVADRLVAEGRLRVGEEVTLVPSPLGFVSGLPRIAESNLVKAVALIWGEGIMGPTPVAVGESGASFALISGRTGDSVLVGRLVNQSVFEFPPAMKGILLVSFFLTVYLTVFLLLNLRQDTITILRDRLKRLQITMLEEYYDRKSDDDWNRWSRELERRREEVRLELKRGLPGKRAAAGKEPPKAERDLDELIDKSWDELVAVIGGRSETRPATLVSANIDEGRLQDILGRVLAASAQSAAPAVAPAAVPAAAPSASPVSAPARVAEAAEEVEELEDLEAPEDLEELDEVEAAETDAPAEMDAADEVLEEVEAADEPEAAELESAEPEEVLEEIEAAEELEPAGAEPVAEAEVVAELESAEPEEVLEEIEAAEEVEVAAPVVIAQPVPPVAASPAVPPVSIDEVEEVEELEEVAAVEETEEIEAAPELESAEAADEFESADFAPGSHAFEQFQKTIRQSNIHVVFGDDDIPYIVESSGLELVDEDVESVMRFLNQDEPTALEELEDEADTSGSATAEDGVREAAPKESKKNAELRKEQLLDEVTRTIEYSPLPESADEADAAHDLEISSPFDTILSDFFDVDSPIRTVPAHELMLIEAAQDDNSAELEEMGPQIESPLVHNPFNGGGTLEPTMLEAMETDSTEAQADDDAADLLSLEEDPGDAIEMKNGIPYVADTVYKPTNDGRSFDPNLKDLVDSVL